MIKLMHNGKTVRALLSFAFSIAVFTAIAQLAPTPAEREKFDPKRDPAADLAKAVVKATKENKRILLDVGGEWCSWCHKLDAFFKDDKDAAAILKASYVVVKVNFSPENKNEAFLSKYPAIKGYPHLFVLDKAGKLIHSQDTGELETGPKLDPAKVVPFLKKWAP
jgi:thioredoxin-related protein